MNRAPDLRFRVSERSKLGQRLRTLDQEHRKSFLDAVLDAGLQSIDFSMDPGNTRGRFENIVELLETLHARWDKLETQFSHVAASLDAISRGHSTRAASSLAPFHEAPITDNELTTLIGTLGRWGPDA